MFSRTTIKQLVDVLDPKPEEVVVYRFARGRVFHENKSPYTTDASQATIGGETITIGGEEVTIQGA